MLAHITAILAKEFQSDFRNPYNLVATLLFLVSSMYTCYIGVNRISDANTWIALFWIILLFTSFNAVNKSFQSEQRPFMVYLYSLCSPQSFIAAKAIYHATVMAVLSLIALVVYRVLFQISIGDTTMLILAVILGSSGFAIALSLLSSIAAKAGNNITLMAILGFPIMLPMILVATRLGKNAVDGLAWEIQWKYLFVLAGLNVVSFALSVVLFPYLWRE